MRFGPLAPFRRQSADPAGGPFDLMRRDFDDLWQRFFEAAPNGAMAAFSPSMDVSETAKQIVIKADLPGLDESQINLEINGDLLTLSGERSDEKTEETEDRRIVERSYGRFERSVRLPFVPGDKDVTTEFRNGVLAVKVKKPKNMETKARRIPIGKAD